MTGEQGREVSHEVRTRLIAQLFETKPTVALNSGAAALLVGGYTAWATNDLVVASLTAVSSGLCGCLYLLLVQIGKRRALIARHARLLELKFGLLSCSITAAVGVMCGRTLAGGVDHSVSMIMFGLMLACVGTVLRNYYRPWLVRLQLASLTGHAILGLFIEGSAAIHVMVFGTLAYAFNVFEITRGLYRSAVQAHKSDDMIKEQSRRFEAALTNMAQGLCMFDADHRLIVCNRKYIDMYGFAADVVKPGISLRELIEHSIAIGNHPTLSGAELEAFLLGQVGGSEPGTFRHLSRGGRVYSVFHEPLSTGGWVATHEDITERQAAEEQVLHMARHDALTGLPNRTHFQEFLTQELARSGDGTLAVLCLDLDRFKAVNDTLGHAIGDALLVQVAARLKSCVEPGDMVARLSGDEFAVVLRRRNQPSAAKHLAKRLVAAIAVPFDVDGHRVISATSIGIALVPAEGTSAESILKQADLALYRAKGDGRGRFCFYATDMYERMEARRTLERDLREALQNGGFHLHYQPLFDASNLAMIGCEALLRWDHPGRGSVSPQDFVSLCEEIGLIVPLGEWVLREGCAVAAALPDHLSIAINLSPAQFHSGRLVETVSHVLATSGLAASRLELEITEGVLLAETDKALTTLHRLRKLGVRIVMDDFGTGYSSLSYLRRFPFDKLKIDRSFISDLGRSCDTEAIVRTTVSLARELGMRITAEGVETEEQLVLLRQVGCSELQGFLLSAPLAATQLAPLMAHNRPSASHRSLSTTAKPKPTTGRVTKGARVTAAGR